MGKKKTKRSIARMCIKKKRTKRHEHTYTLNATQNRQTEKKTGDVVEIEIQINCTSTGLFQKNKQIYVRFMFFLIFVYICCSGDDGSGGE